MIFCGVDPGKHGGIVAIDGASAILDARNTPLIDGDYDLNEMLALVRTWTGGDTHVAIEQAHAFPRIGARSNFEVGRGFGLWLGILGACRVPHTVVSAGAWHRALTHGISVPKGLKKASKVKARIAAERLWPGQFKASQDGQIDAALIAEWLRRELH